MGCLRQEWELTLDWWQREVFESSSPILAAIGQEGGPEHENPASEDALQESRPGGRVARQGGD